VIRIAAVLTLALAGCAPHDHGARDHTHREEHREEADARPALSFTDWTEQTELFMELPALVKGAESACAVHVTKLDDFRALAAGSVAVILRRAGGEERFSASAPTAPGIFRPVARPTAVGLRRLIVEIAAGDLSARHDLGDVTVFESADAARRAISEAAEPAGRITFLKEQQWPIPFATETVRERAMSESMTAPGVLVAPEEADLTVRAPVAGRVVRAEGGYPQVGREVAAGDVLAVLAPRLEAADVASLDLAIQQGQLAVRYAENERRRLEGLRQEGAVPERRALEAKHAEDAARAALATAERRLAQFRRVEATSGRGQGSVPLLSPIAGAIEQVQVAPGAFVEAGARLFRVLDVTRLRLEVRVAEVDAPGLSVRGASFTVPGGVRRELGADALVGRSHAVDPRTRTLSYWFAVDNGDRSLAAGTLADVALQTGELRRALAVPESALVDDGGIPVVFVQVEGEVFERRIVRTTLRDRGYVAIEQGLSPGEHVVKRGAYAVKLASASGSIPAHGHAH
jgi:membrane fusion protein, heavy metal efflux system